MVASSTANVADIVEEYGGILLHENGSTLSGAINQGFTGLDPNIRYIAWLGDDDILAPGSLETTLSILERYPDAPFVFGRIRYINENNNSKWVLRPGRWAVAYAKYGHNFIGQPGSLLRLSSFQNIGQLDVDLKNSMDQDMFLKLSILGPYKYVARELACFRVHPDSISSTKGSEDEMSSVRDNFRVELPGFLDRLSRVIFHISDRILLSVHCRIPNKIIPMWDGKEYFKV